MEKHESHKPAGQQIPPQKGVNLSPWARYWARQHQRPQDSHLVGFGDRITFTFAVGTGAASIHYDLARGEIFYKGHRLMPEDCNENMRSLLHYFKEVLAQSEYAEQFLAGYKQTLSKLTTP